MIERYLTKQAVLASLPPILVVVMQACCSWDATEAYNGIAKPGCQDECGGVKIPFPFGIGPGCYYIGRSGDILIDTYRIVCNNTNDPPKPLLPILGNREVLSISARDHTIRVSSGVAYDCYNTGESVPSANPNLTNFSGNYNNWVPFLMSTTRNRFVSIGCDTRAFLSDDLYPDIASCTTSCPNMDPRHAGDGVCESDLGCCEVLLSRYMREPAIQVGSSSNHTDMAIDHNLLCAYAFLAEVGSYNFSVSNLTATAKDCYDIRVPLVYDWFLDFLVYDNCTVTNATEYDGLKITLCSSNSMFECAETNMLFPFSAILTCQCRQGYSGINPYLPNGCQDINECLDERMNNCQKTEYCVNTEGGYDCRCPAGHLGNGTIASPCIHVPSDIKLILGLSVGLGSMIGFVVLYGLYKLIKWRKEIKEREHNFKRNGGLLLQQEMSTNEGAINRTKIFNRIELEKATDNFNVNRVLGHGGQGTVYKGMLTDGTIVAVKKSKKVDENQLAQFINEVVILSQINHRNVVKLFGCCLETDVPLLVYEFVPNGTLYRHIHHPSEDFHMTWKVRSQIAVECARAVAYLHSSCSSPIYHRDIKSSNILIDEKYKAKVSDFGTSRTISIDKTHVTTCVQGTFGYLDPEFFRSSQFSEKSDVYSFGVVLLELITSKKPIFTNTFGEPRGLAIEFVQIMETSPDQLHEILDTQVLQHCSGEEIEELAKLVERCLSMNGKERPTMREVAMALEMVIKSQQVKDEIPVTEEIRGEERHVLIEEASTTNEDSSFNSTINLPR